MFGAKRIDSSVLWFLVFVLFASSFGLQAEAKYGGGSGTVGDPYQIATAADLITLGEDPNDYDKHFILVADIDLDPNLPGRKVFDNAVIAPDADQTKDGFQGTPFPGVFDGNGHTISHLTIEGKDYLGLFGQLGSGARVRDLAVVGVNIGGSGSNLGGVVAYNNGDITQCYSTGAVSGNSSVGGLVGHNGDYYRPSTVTLCYSTCAVSGSSEVGGLVGYTIGTVIHCYSTGAVGGTGSSVGGLVGINWMFHMNSTITHCFWDTQTSGRATSAGGTGKSTAEMQTARAFLNAGWDFVGEIENGASEIWQMPEGGGYPVLAIFSGYSPPQLQGHGTPEDPYLIHDALELGAMVHYSPSAHYRLAASIDLSGIRWGTAVVPWFAGMFDGNDLTVSHLTIQGRGYLGLFGQLALGAEVKDLGVVDVNIAVSGGGTVGGLVGYNYGTVTQCHSTGAISGNVAVGGLVGYNYGTMTRCINEAVVMGRSPVGGLVGGNGNKGTVTQCYSTGVVNGSERVGGLVGNNWGTVTRCINKATVMGRSPVGGLVGSNYNNVTQCYSTGTVMGSDNVGGLVGNNGGGTAMFCYSTGMVWGIGEVVQRVGGLVGGNPGIVTYCFWGIGKTLAAMRTAQTFLEAGWDFVGETANGTEDIWWIDEGQDYPRLVWEYHTIPQDGAGEVCASPILGWAPGRRAVEYDVYLGEDWEVVAQATARSPEIYRGRQSWKQITYDTGILEWYKTYYWRIDEVNEADPNSPWKGDVWSFTTGNFLIVDDFESYTDDELSGKTISDTWIGRWSGTGGSYVGNAEPPFAEQTVVHGGKQSMPMEYYNGVELWYSQAERTWETPQDWTFKGVDTLTLYFRGQVGNGRDPLYVAIQDSSGRIAVVTHPDADAVPATQWQRWQIPLADLRAAGVDPAAVKMLVIGVGDRNNPQLGGTGKIYIDDIRLTKRMP